MRFATVRHLSSAPVGYGGVNRDGSTLGHFIHGDSEILADDWNKNYD